jgi:hypothetical protein
MTATLVGAETVLSELQENGIAVLPGFVPQEQLNQVQLAFDAVLRRMRWNDFDGYEKNDQYRLMVQNVLTLDQGFVDAALHPVVKDVLREYIGDSFELVEAKGWKSLPTREDFHGWHGDAWYDQSRVSGMPREVKLAVYLTDVRSGAFNYIKGSQQKQAPRTVRDAEVNNVAASDIVSVVAPAGTAFLFDTSGIHRQATPILEPRCAVFYNYHDPSVPLQQEDVTYYRYHPLILNAAFLGNLSDEDRRILGFGNKTNLIPGFQREPRHTMYQRLASGAFDAKLRVDSVTGRVRARLRRTLNMKSH